MKMEFIKAHGQGNDYIFFDLLDQKIPDISYNDLAIKLSKRRFSIGSDGIVLILPDKNYSCYMRIFNSDGSEAKNCGTALRCVAAILHEKTGSVSYKINTLSGVKVAEIKSANPYTVEVDMGKPEIFPDMFENCGMNGHVVDVGNPHFIVIQKHDTHNSLLSEGKKLENGLHQFGRVNVELLSVKNPENIAINIWERGSGITSACGTGATASAFLTTNLGLTKKSVRVDMPGGYVTIVSNGKSARLIGEIEILFHGFLFL